MTAPELLLLLGLPILAVIALRVAIDWDEERAKGAGPDPLVREALHELDREFTADRP